MFKCLRSATESLRNLGKISVSQGMSYMLKIERKRAENPMTNLFLMNWLQIPSHDSQSLSSSIHWQFCYKCMFILCLGLRLHIRAWISQNKDIYKPLFELKSGPNESVFHTQWALLCCESLQTKKGLHLWSCAPRETPSQNLRSLLYGCCLYWQPGKPSLWSNTDVVNALHANKMHTVTKSGLKPRKKTCSPWNKLIVIWAHSASEFKRRVVNGVRMNHL